MQPKYKILIIEDDKSITSTLRDILTDKGYLVEVAENAAAAQTRMASANLVLIDLCLPDKPGIQLLQELKEVNPEAEALIITGYADVRSAIDAVNMGACAYLEKPVHPEQLVLVVKRALEKWQLAWELKRREQEIKGLAGLTGDILNERVLLLEEARKKEEQLSKLLRNISISCRLLDPVQVARELLSQIVEITGANHASFVFLEPHIKITERVRIFKDMKPFPINPISGGTLDTILQSGEPVFIPDITRHPHAHPAFVAAGIKSTVGYPLVLDKIIHGVLFLHSFQEDGFASYRDLIAAFADLCIIPIKISLLYQAADIARREWEATVSATGRGVAVVDSDRKIIRANNLFCEMVGVPMEQLDGKSICELVHGKPDLISGCLLEKACMSGKVENLVIEEPFLKIKKLDVRIVPVAGPDGKIIRSIHAFRNLDNLS